MLCQTAEYVCLMGRGTGQSGLMLVGEAPGHREDDIGKPFQGRAGKLLDEILGELGIDRASIFITNIVKCRPPANRTPFPSEVVACHPHLVRELVALKPLIVVPLGRAATEVFLDRKVPITRDRGKRFQCPWSTAFEVVPTIHPAFVLRNPTWRHALKRDLDHAWHTASNYS